MTIAEILESMAYGPAPETDGPAQAWIDAHGRAFGMYIGGGQIVHAPHSGDVVRVASMGYVGSPIGYGRP